MGLVSVRLFANLREIVGNPRLVFEASTIRDVLMTLRSEHPALQPLLCDDGEVRPYITILINGKNIRDMEALATILSDGDEVAIFPPVSGG
jgi:MoaD family protein, archaeal